MLSVAAAHPPGRNRRVVLRRKPKGWEIIEFIHLFLLAEDRRGTNIHVLTEHQFHHRSSDGRTGLIPVNPPQEGTELFLFQGYLFQLHFPATGGQQTAFSWVLSRMVMRFCRG